MSTLYRSILNSLSLRAVQAAGLALAGAFILIAGMTEGRSATNYSFADAAYVTTSRNIDVLEYVVCLEGAVNKTPEAMPLAEALRIATGACRDLARLLPDTPGEPSAKDIVDTIRECGFFPEQASPDADCAGSGGVVAGGPDEVELTPVVIDVGKWPEGIVFDDEWLWVAESGDRTIAGIDLESGRVAERRKVGRLPVDMATAGEGVVYTLVVTDKLINKQNARGAGSTLAKLSECPETMADGIDFLWVVTLPDCSSADSRLVRIDPATGKQVKSAVLGEWALAVAAQGPDVWIAHARAPALTVVNQQSMKAQTVEVGDAELWTISANSVHVFAGGRRAGSSDDGLVVMIDPLTGSELARASVTERVSEIYSDEDDVVAVGDKGTIWIYAAADLALRRTITLSTGPFEPRDIIVLDDRLVLSVANHVGENGAIFLLEDWLPSDAASGAVAGNLPPPAVVNPPRRSTGVTPPKPEIVANPPKRTVTADPPPASRVTNPPRPAAANPPIGQKKAVAPDGRAGFPVAAGSWGGNVRKAPSTGAAWVASLKEGEAVMLMERTGEVMNGYPWFRIKFRGNQTGYKWGGILCATVKPVAGIEGTCTTASAGAGNQQPPKSANPKGNLKGINPKRPPAIDPGDVSALLGTFQRDPVQNDWHTGTIERDGGKLRWTNLAGVSWSLTADLARDRLLTGQDNPYFAQGIREFTLIRDHGDVVGFRFGNETYSRAPEVRVLVVPPPAGGAAARGAIRERHLPLDPGLGAVVRTDGIPRGERDAYRIFAQAGEILTVSVSAPDDNAAFEIRIGGTGGRALPGAGGGDEARFWSGIAPQDGDYLIIIGPRFGGTDYTLTASLDVQQQPGADGHEDAVTGNAGDPAEDPRAGHDYSMVAGGDKQACASQHSERTSAFFDCLDGFKRQALAGKPTATPDKRADQAYSGLANGAYQSCALTHGEGSNAYYVCLNEIVDYEAGQSAGQDPAGDPLAGKDYSMIDHDVRKDCQAGHGDATAAFVECMDVAKAAVEERDRLATEARAEQARLDEEARQQEQARLDEEARQQEQARLDEEVRLEQERLDEEARQQEQARLEEEARLEQERLDEEARQQEQARLDEEARLEQERLDEEARQQEQARLDEEARLQAEADAQAQQQQEQTGETTE